MATRGVMAAPGQTLPARRRADRTEAITAWLMSAPALVLLVLFVVVPFIMAIGSSFTNQRLTPGPLPTQFVGLRNYSRILEDPVFWQSIRNNVVFALVVVPLQSALALLLALLTNVPRRFVVGFRAIYFLPTVTTMVVVAVIWTFLFSSNGLVNAVLRAISLGTLGPYRWLDDVRLALPAIMVVSIWQGVGFQMVIYLAGLQGIPAERYEAAQIDGASRWQQFWYITMPGLRNTHIFVLVTTTILAFKLFTQVEVMTQGGPLDATQTIVRYMFQSGFRELRVGYASAMSVLFVIIVLAISLVQRWLLREEREIV
ncbi:MAG TPA: sugar ABC transporter permease [Limnochordales bacterium]